MARRPAAGVWLCPALALAAYNAGPAPVAACGCVPPYRETQDYVAKILGLLSGAGEIAADTLEVRLVECPVLSCQAWSSVTLTGADVVLVLLLALLGLAFGAAVRRWYALLLPVGVPVYSLGVEWGWWGHGTGDMWELATFLVTAVTACAVAVGMMLGRILIARRPRRSDSA